jgi:hypothetical protein
VQDKAAEAQVLKDFLMNFLHHLQDCIDFDMTVCILIENELAGLLIEQLQEETDDCARNMSDLGVPVKFSGSARYKPRAYGYTPSGRYFAKHPRMRLLVNLIN